MSMNCPNCGIHIEKEQYYEHFKLCLKNEPILSKLDDTTEGKRKLGAVFEGDWTKVSQLQIKRKVNMYQNQ